MTAFKMKRFWLTILCFALFCGLSYPKNKVALKGRVSDTEGRPLSGIKVEISEIPSRTQTLPDGSFVLKNIPPGVYHVVFTHPDYLADSATVDLREETSKFIQVTLAARNPILLTIKEEITVTAEADSIIDVSLPSHRTILPSSVLTELGTANIAEAVEKIPGVEMVGKGGYSMVPAIRGLAEHRILMLMDGVRITSQRRIGASASFVNLNDIDHIEVNRGPYSVFHGSGAIGGIINIVTRTPSPQDPFRGAVNLGYNTVEKEGRAGLDLRGSWKGFGLMMAANAKKAGDYSSPSGEIEQSHYTDYDLIFKVNRGDRDSRFYLTMYNYWGVDIGKPSPSSKSKPRWYPKERNTIFTLGYRVKNKLHLDTLNASFYFFPSMLKTQKENFTEILALKKRNLAKLEGTNFGLKLRCGKQLGKKHTLNFGFDFFGQTSVEDKNTEWKYDSLGDLMTTTEETSLRDARRENLGFFVDDKFQISSSLTLNIGARFDTIHTSNSVELSSPISRSDTSLSGYIGSLLQITSRLSFLLNLGRSFRFPTISELFYTGLTGRGTVFGNPDLEPEKSLNLDVGLRYLHERFYASIYGFTNSVSDMIQKYLGSGEEEYYYRNLQRGRITGIEGEFYVWLAEDVELFLNFHHMEGREQQSDDPLNYIPTSRLALWTKFSPGKFWVEPKITLSAAQEDPGPLEIETDGYTLLEAIFGYKFSTHLTLLAIVQNLLNQEYRANADEQGVVAPGRGVVLKVSCSF